MLRKLGGCDVVAVGLEALYDRAPAGAVGPRAVDEDDFGELLIFIGSLAGVLKVHKWVRAEAIIGITTI